MSPEDGVDHERVADESEDESQREHQHGGKQLEPVVEVWGERKGHEGRLVDWRRSVFIRVIFNLNYSS